MCQTLKNWEVLFNNNMIFLVSFLSMPINNDIIRTGIFVFTILLYYLNFLIRIKRTISCF